jgi:hypothetical protein
LSSRMTILDCYTSKAENLSLTLMLLTMVTKNVIPPRRQARKERPLFISPNLGDLCAFARDAFFHFFFIPKISNMFG